MTKLILISSLKLQKDLMGGVLGRIHPLCLKFLKFLMEGILFPFELDLPDAE